MHFCRLKISGFSLAELITTVAIIGILSAMAIVGYSGVQDGARLGVAQDTVAILNRALLHFNQANWDIVLDPQTGNDAADELAVVHTLKWRNPDPALASPGSPYIPNNFSEIPSSDTQDYRIQWNGFTFQLIPPGTAGTGLKTGFDSGGGNTPYSFLSGYQPLGPNQHE